MHHHRVTWDSGGYFYPADTGDKVPSYADVQTELTQQWNTHLLTDKSRLVQVGDTM